MRCLFTGTALALLAGCTTTPASVDTPGPVAYRAVGNEPGWSATIANGRMVMLLDYGERKIDVAIDSRPSFNGHRYSGGKAVLDVTHQLCKNVMSGMNYPDRATAMVDGKTFQGCGGDPVSLLTGEEWVVEDIGGKGIIDSSRATMRFADGQVNGRASCNTYGAATTFTGEGFGVGPIRSTRMACAPALMNQEAFFLDILAKAARFDFSEDGALLIEDSQGRRITARRG